MPFFKANIQISLTGLNAVFCTSSGNNDDDDDDVDYDNDNQDDDAKSQCCFEIQRNERVMKIWPF